MAKAKRMHDPSTGYYVGAGMATRSVFRCSCHGQEFDTRALQRAHTRAFLQRIRRDFAALVQERGLGQIQPWDRLPGETPLEYNRFQCYLRTETIENVSKVTGADFAAIRRIAKKWNWSLRADLLHQHVERQEMEEHIQNKRRSGRKQAALGRKLQEVAMAGAEALLSDPDRLAEMSGNEIAKLTDVGVKVERLGNQDPTAISEDRSISIVWEGPAPDWAPRDPADKAKNITPGPLTQKVLEGER